MRVWPFAALAVYLQPVGTFPYHSFQGLAIPLSILAVQGVASRWPRPRPALVVAAWRCMTLPGHRAQDLSVAANSIHAAGDPYFVFQGEQRALDALERDPRAGRRAGAAVRRAHAPVPHRARGLRRRAVVDAELGRGGCARRSALFEGG